MCNIVDCGDVDFSATGGKERYDDIYAVYKEFYKRGISTLTCGGEHTMSRPITIALGEDDLICGAPLYSPGAAQSLLYAPQIRLESKYSHFYAHWELDES